MLSKSTLSDNAVKTIEAALESLKEQPKFELPADKQFVTKPDRVERKTIYDSFINHVVNNGLTVDELRVAFDTYTDDEANKPVAVFGAKETIAMHVIGLNPSVTINLFRPSRGSFDWSKTDWISDEAEYEAFYQHVERVLSREYQYRLGYGAAKSAN